MWGCPLNCTACQAAQGETGYSGGPKGTGLRAPWGRNASYQVATHATSARSLLVTRRVAVVMGVGAARPLQSKSTLQVLV